jgi:REP element-mobilizing transposase RayT
MVACRVARILGDPALWLPHRCLCWVLMPDHWHGLLQLGQTGDLSTAMRIAKNMSARQLAYPHGVARRLWADGFHDRALRRDDDIRAVARYIVANPLRAGLTSDILAYPYWDSVWLSPTANPDITL